MHTKSGFFNSISPTNPDRLYDSTDFGVLFRGIWQDGIFRDYLSALEVTTISGEGNERSINVSPGKAWFNDTWLYQPVPEPLTIAPSFVTQDRFDLVVMDFDRRVAARTNKIMVVEGVPGGGVPVPIVETDHIQVALAEVKVPKNTSTVEPEHITDRRGQVGSPWAGMSLDSVVNDSVLASSLHARPHRNIVINGDMRVYQRLIPLQAQGGTEAGGYRFDPLLTSYSGYSLGQPDRWRLEYGDLAEAGSWIETKRETILAPGDSISRSWLTVNLNNTKNFVNQPTGAHRCILSQRIANNRLSETHRGLPDARELTLSFIFQSNMIGDYVVELRDVANNVSYSAVYSNPFADIVTPISIVIPRDSVNRSFVPDGEGLRLNIWLSAGTDYTSGVPQDQWMTTVDANRAKRQTAFLGSVVSGVNRFRITDVQLEAGPNVSQYARMSYPETLNQCREYYEAQHRDCIFVPTNPDGGTSLMGHMELISNKRVAPNVSIISLTKADSGSGTISAGTVSWPGGNTSKFFNLSATASSGFTGARQATVILVADSEL